MLSRKIEAVLNDFYDKKEKKALLITGARQVGKTFSIREFGRSSRMYGFDYDNKISGGRRILSIYFKRFPAWS